MDKKQIFQQFSYSWILFNRNNKSALIAIGLYFLSINKILFEIRSFEFNS